MSNEKALKPGERVVVPWGLGTPRGGVVLEVWGDPSAPTHFRVLLDSTDPGDEEQTILLLGPDAVSPAA